MYPRLFTIGSFSVPTYGVLVAIGFLVGLFLVSRSAKRAGLNPDHVGNLAIYVFLAAIVGAKGFMILANADYYFSHPGRIFSLSALQAGGVFYGGLLAALGTAFWFTRKYDLPWLGTADIFAPGLAIGHGVGRLGCFAAGCCWGKESSLPWAISFTDPIANQFVGVPLNVDLHPTQLYESFGTLVVGFFLLWLCRRPHISGTIIGWYLILYSTFRLGVEFLRDTSGRVFPGDIFLSTTQWIALGLILSGIIVLVWRKNSQHIHKPERSR